MDRALAVGCFPLSAESGVLLLTVQQGGPADQAGIQTCDVIVRIQGKYIDTFVDHLGVLNDYRAGVTVDVELIRQNDRRSTETTLG